jgi:ligand-binding sensor domain-containing protein
MRAFGLLLVALALLPAPIMAQPEVRADSLTLITSYADLLAVARGPRHVWAGAANGIIAYDFVEDRWEVPVPLPRLAGEDWPSALAWDGAAGVLWLGTDGGQLFSHTPGTVRWEREGEVRGEVLRIMASPDGDGVLVRTLIGWSQWQLGGRVPRALREEQLPEQARRPDPRQAGAEPALDAARGAIERDARLQRFPISDAVQGEAQGEWWLATRGGGLVRFRATTLETTRLLFGTLSEGAGSLATDGDWIWIGGDAQGRRTGVTAARTDFSRWISFESPFDGAPAGFVARIAPARDAVWFAASDGLYRLDRAALSRPEPQRSDWTHWTTANGLPADAVTAVVPGEAETWVGTLAGLVRIDGARAASANLMPDRRVLDLALLRDTLWIATDAGLFVLDAAAAGERPARAPGTENRRSLDSTIVGVRAWGNGVVALTPDALHVHADGVWTGPVREPSVSVLGALYRMGLDESGTLWVGGAEGVSAFRSGSRDWRVYRVGADLPEGPVRGIAFTPGVIWVATPAGAVRLATRQ